jgi:hypothetical protein
MQSNLYKKSIQTYSGREFNLLDMSGNVCDIVDISHALSNICRYCGHTRVHYSVAQHSVQVSYLVPKHMALKGLLHDADEAYIGDVAKPLKELLPDYKQVEARIGEFVLGWFGIDVHTMPPEIKRADIQSLVTEQRDLMHGSDEAMMTAFRVLPLPERIRPLSPRKAEKLFLRRYYEIVADMSIESALERCAADPGSAQFDLQRTFGLKSWLARAVPAPLLVQGSRWDRHSSYPTNASAQELLRRSLRKAKFKLEKTKGLHA